MVRLEAREQVETVIPRGGMAEPVEPVEAELEPELEAQGEVEALEAAEQPETTIQAATTVEVTPAMRVLVQRLRRQVQSIYMESAEI